MAGDAAGPAATERPWRDSRAVDRAAANAPRKFFGAEQHDHDAGGGLEHDRAPAHARIAKPDPIATDSVDGADRRRNHYHVVVVPVRNRKFQTALRAGDFADAVAVAGAGGDRGYRPAVSGRGACEPDWFRTGALDFCAVPGGNAVIFLE